MWIVFGLLSALTAALTTICGKIGLKNTDATLATGVRSLIMFLFMLIILISTKKINQISTLDARAWRWIIAAGIFGALSWLFYFLGLQQTTASKLAALDRLSLPFIIAFSVLMLSEKFSWSLAIGGSLVTIGAMVIVRA